MSLSVKKWKELIETGGGVESRVFHLTFTLTLALVGKLNLTLTLIKTPGLRRTDGPGKGERITTTMTKTK
jgi:hypothetical protein